MNIILLIFFALPILVIVVSIALQRLLKCPCLVAAIVFAIFLVVTFIIANLNFLVAAIAYAILSFLTAVLVSFICNCQQRNREKEGNCTCRKRYPCQGNGENTNNLLTIQSQCGNNDDGNLLTISSNGCNGTTNDLLTIQSNCNDSNNSNNGCCRPMYCNNNGRTNAVFTISENGFVNANENLNAGCGCQNQTNNGVNARIDVIPNPNTNGRTGCVCGNYRRR